MSKEYFFLYLIYGFAFINIGIFSIQEKNIEVSNLPLVKSMSYLGLFGITHGISEWVTMLIITDLYPSALLYLFNFKQVLKAISFAYLIYFGISLLPVENSYKSIVKRLSILLFLIWASGFLFLIIYKGLDYHYINPKFNIILLRYIMGFSGGIISAVSLYMNANLMDGNKLEEIGNRYRSLGHIFLIYGILDGIIVREANFFPANFLNNKLFLKLFKFPIQVLKAFVGIRIAFLLIKVIDTFDWEQREKIRRLEKQRIAQEERRKLGLEIHDSIIQGLYGAGLKVEYLMKIKSEEKSDNVLQEIKSDLNETIMKTREFVAASTLDIIELEDLNDNIEELVENFNRKQSIKIEYKCEMSSMLVGQLSPEKSTQVYYIIQEAICNVIKHSKATCAQVKLETTHDYLHIKVKDNGIGICFHNIDSEKRFGIKSMKERAEKVQGAFHIENFKNGTKIKVLIPWEG